MAKKGADADSIFNPGGSEIDVEPVEDSSADPSSSEPSSTESPSTESSSTEPDPITEAHSPPTSPPVESPSETDRGVAIPPSELAEEYVPESYDLPHAWALGRKTVKSGRPKTKTFTLQDKVHTLEKDAEHEVNDILGGDVSLTDIREAALIIGYSNPELIADLVSGWGAEHS